MAKRKNTLEFPRGHLNGKRTSEGAQKGISELDEFGFEARGQVERKKVWEEKEEDRFVAECGFQRSQLLDAIRGAKVGGLVGLGLRVSRNTKDIIVQNRTARYHYEIILTLKWNETNYPVTRTRAYFFSHLVTLLNPPLPNLKIVTRLPNPRGFPSAC